MKFYEIPPHSKDVYTDILLKCIKFILPESSDISRDMKSMCKTRKFKAFVFANYTDNNYKCCNT